MSTFTQGAARSSLALSYYQVIPSGFQLIDFDLVQAFHRGLDRLKCLEHIDARLLSRRSMGIVHQAGHGLENRGRALLQARHLLFPGKLLLRALQQIGQISDVFARGVSALVLRIHSVQLKFQPGNGFLTPVDVFHQRIKL